MRQGRSLLLVEKNMLKLNLEYLLKNLRLMNFYKNTKLFILILAF